MPGLVEVSTAAAGRPDTDLGLRIPEVFGNDVYHLIFLLKDAADAQKIG